MLCAVSLSMTLHPLLSTSLTRCPVLCHWAWNCILSLVPGKTQKTSRHDLKLLARMPGVSHYIFRLVPGKTQKTSKQDIDQDVIQQFKEVSYSSFWWQKWWICHVNHISQQRIHLRNKFDFLSIHEIINTSGLLQCNLAKDLQRSWFHEQTKNRILYLYLHFMLLVKFHITLLTLLNVIAMSVNKQCYWMALVCSNRTYVGVA